MERELPLHNGDLGPYVLRMRVADLEDKDFIELEFGELTYSHLMEVCCNELGLDPVDIEKIRKLDPIKTKIRSDEDVKRFNRLEHLEVVIIPARRQHNYNYQFE